MTGAHPCGRGRLFAKARALGHDDAVEGAAVPVAVEDTAQQARELDRYDELRRRRGPDLLQRLVPLQPTLARFAALTKPDDYQACWSPQRDQGSPRRP